MKRADKPSELISSSIVLRPAASRSNESCREKTELLPRPLTPALISLVDFVRVSLLPSLTILIHRTDNHESKAHLTISMRNIDEKRDVLKMKMRLKQMNHQKEQLSP